MTEEDSTLLRAQLVPVARDLEAKAGQRLIIVAGVCVGVYTGDKPPRRERMPEPAEIAERPRLAPKPRQSNGAIAISRGGRDNPKREAMRRELVAAITRNGGELYAFEITRELGAAQDARRGYYLRCAVGDLEADGTIEIGGKSGKGRLYRIRPKPPAAVEGSAA